MKATKIPPVCAPVVERVVEPPKPNHKPEKQTYTAVEIAQAMKQLIERSKPKQIPSETRDARSARTGLQWFNNLMAVDVGYDELVGNNRTWWAVLAREAVATRMKFIGILSYPDISQQLRGTRNRHSTIISAVGIVTRQIFGEEVPSEENVSRVLRAMSDEAWYGVLAAIHEARVSR